MIRMLIVCILLFLSLFSFGCISRSNVTETPVEDTVSYDVEEIISLSDVEDTAVAVVYDKPIVKERCFIVVSKKDLTLAVYEARENDTALIARFDCCLGKNFGNKQKRGDMKTPESTLHNPFKILSIENSSWWTHDFGDGRGSIRAYGKWFMRLSSNFTGIGIHGSTNNEASVPGRFSEGCIRLRDADIETLKSEYAFVGMKVVVKGEDEGKLSFER